MVIFILIVNALAFIYLLYAFSQGWKEAITAVENNTTLEPNVTRREDIAVIIQLVALLSLFIIELIQ